eukprot:gb/GECH01012962.1/.p1 GENE.gb/GECH01012962.1/~~gb/GECH01012962.1/.p1  ORF type:complete len:408 (+),score=74.19 gb/GECH01012962.1/:1-1224(+)
MTRNNASIYYLYQDAVGSQWVMDMIDQYSEDDVNVVDVNENPTMKQKIERSLGVVMGTCFGDTLGAASEFETYHSVREKYGKITRYIQYGMRSKGYYTDDTEMTFALISSLIQRKCCDAKHLAYQYAIQAKSLPIRGYGPSVSGILSKLHRDYQNAHNKARDANKNPQQDWFDFVSDSLYLETATMIHSEGSYANGGVMRIAPISIAFSDDSDEILHEAVEAALRCTHVHPEAIDGAYIQAKAIQKLISIKPSEVNPIELIQCLISESRNERVKNALKTTLSCFNAKYNDLEFLDKLCEGNQFGRHFQIRASEAIATSFWAFLHHYNDPIQQILLTVNLGGDADTTSAITGALAGALHGCSWFPSIWLQELENEGNFGKDGLIKSAISLCGVNCNTILNHFYKTPKT